MGALSFIWLLVPFYSYWRSSYRPRLSFKQGPPRPASFFLKVFSSSSLPLFREEDRGGGTYIYRSARAAVSAHTAHVEDAASAFSSVVVAAVVSPPSWVRSPAEELRSRLFPPPNNFLTVTGATGGLARLFPFHSSFECCWFVPLFLSLVLLFLVLGSYQGIFLVIALPHYRTISGGDDHQQ